MSSVVGAITRPVLISKFNRGLAGQILLMLKSVAQKL